MPVAGNDPPLVWLVSICVLCWDGAVTCVGRWGGCLPACGGGCEKAKLLLCNPANECEDTVEFKNARRVAFCVAYGFPYFGIG